MLTEVGDPADRRVWESIGSALSEVSRTKVSDLREYDETVREQNEDIIRSVTKAMGRRRPKACGVIWPNSHAPKSGSIKIHQSLRCSERPP